LSSNINTVGKSKLFLEIVVMNMENISKDILVLWQIYFF
jgi:hypothetical protein